MLVETMSTPLVEDRIMDDGEGDMPPHAYSISSMISRMSRPVLLRGLESFHQVWPPQDGPPERLLSPPPP